MHALYVHLQKFRIPPTTTPDLLQIPYNIFSLITFEIEGPGQAFQFIIFLV